MTNGEKFKTAEERRSAYGKYCAECRKHKTLIEDKFEWLELEYKVVLEPCPFCDGEAELREGEFSFVKCSNCDAESFHGETSDEVVAAWNRRAK